MKLDAAMAQSAECWELYYYGQIAGRAEFVRLVFEEAGVKYKEVGDIETMMKIRDGKLDGVFPAFAPPMIKKGDFTLAQTPVICKYLGKQFGLYPDNSVDEWHGEQINATVHDYIAEGRLVFHGKNFVQSYHEQAEETKPYVQWFVDSRLERWLTNFERYLQANGGGNGFIVGDKVTYVDLGVLHILRATESQFNDKWKSLESIPLLKAFKKRLEARQNLAAYFKSDRCRPFEGNSMM